MINIARAECAERAERAMWHDQKHVERKAEGGNQDIYTKVVVGG